MLRAGRAKQEQVPIVQWMMGAVECTCWNWTPTHEYHGQFCCPQFITLKKSLWCHSKEKWDSVVGSLYSPPTMPPFPDLFPTGDSGQPSSFLASGSYVLGTFSLRPSEAQPSMGALLGSEEVLLKMKAVLHESIGMERLPSWSPLRLQPAPWV